MGSIISRINTYTQDLFDYGTMAKCPNCNSRTILAYPTTVCTKCKNRFKNDIVVVDIHTYYYLNNNKKSITLYGTSNNLVLR